MGDGTTSAITCISRCIDCTVTEQLNSRKRKFGFTELGKNVDITIHTREVPPSPQFGAIFLINLEIRFTSILCSILVCNCLQ